MVIPREVPSTKKESWGSPVTFSREIWGLERVSVAEKGIEATTHEHPVGAVAGTLGNELVSENGGAGDGMDSVGSDEHVGLEDLSFGEGYRSFVAVL